MDAVFFDGVVAGWALLAVGIAFKPFCLLDDVAHFAEEAENVVLDDRGSVFQRCFVFRLAETVDGQFGAADAFADALSGGFSVWMVVFVCSHSHCPFLSLRVAAGGDHG